MATAYKTQQLVGSGTITSYTNLYATGASTTAIVSAIHVCNESASAPVTVRIGISPTNGTTAPASGKFLFYDAVIPANQTLTWNGPLTLGNTAYLNCSSNAATVSFTAAVAEVS